MQRLKMFLWSPKSRHQIGVIRLAVVGIMMASALAGGVAFIRHAPAAARPAHAPLPPAHTAKKDCGCSAAHPVRLGKAGGRPAMHLAQAATGNNPLTILNADGTPDTTPSDGSVGEFEVPADAGFDAVEVAYGGTLDMATTSPLPIGDGPDGGHWSATFGTITPDGTRYTAPTDDIPMRLDEISYTPRNATGPMVNLMVKLVGSPTAGSDPMLASARNRGTARLAARLVTASEYACLDEAVPVYASLRTLKSVPGNLRRRYLKEVQWLEKQPKHTLRLAADTVPDGGYLLPAKVDTGTVQVYVPAASSQASQTRVCHHGPINGTPGPSPACKPGQTGYTSSGWQYREPQWSGWSSTGYFDLNVDASMSTTIKLIYNVDISVGLKTHTPVRSRSVFYVRVLYFDNYYCSNGKWKYYNTTKCVQNCNGLLFDPKWVSVLRGWPKNGECGDAWTPPYDQSCHSIGS